MKRFSFLFILSLIFTFHASAQNLKTAIASIGCKQIKVSDLKPMRISQTEFETWQKETFQLQSKQSFIAKCRAKDGLFYRVLFEEETFADQSIAVARLPKIRLLPPKEDDKSELAVPIILREGFRRKNKVYTVGVFAAFLADNAYHSSLNEKLKKIIK